MLWVFTYRDRGEFCVGAVEAGSERAAFELAQGWCATNSKSGPATVRPFVVAVEPAEEKAPEKKGNTK